MKITAAQLRQIIKEEVQNLTRKSTRRLSENEQFDAVLEIPDVSMHAAHMGMPVKNFLKHAYGLGRLHNVRPEGPGNDMPAYSEEYDSLSFVGSRADLESFARELDEEMMGGAQSISGEDSFVNYIQDL